MNKILLVLGLILIVTIGVLIYESFGEWITVRAKIVKKYERTSTTFIFIPNSNVFVPLIRHHYYFVMDNGDTIEVSYSDYLKYNVGDIYKYRKRKG